MAYVLGPISITGSAVSMTGSLSTTGPIDGLGGLNVTGELEVTGSLITTGSMRVLGDVNVTGSINLTGSLQPSQGSTIISNYPISVTGSTLYSTAPAAGLQFNTTNSIYLGDYAGYNALNTKESNFFGYYAGKDAVDAYRSNFLGWSAGELATRAISSNFIGYLSGYSASAALYGNFIGDSSGYGAVSASDSIFIGRSAGGSAKFSYGSIFIGAQAGDGVKSGSYSIYLGYHAGQPGAGEIGAGNNNIIIGTNVGIPQNSQNKLNIGGVIFGTGLYSNTGGYPFTGSAMGNIGINQPSPQYTLDVSGSVGISTLLNISASHPLPAGVVGHLAVSASHLWFYNGAWTQLD